MQLMVEQPGGKGVLLNLITTDKFSIIVNKIMHVVSAIQCGTDIKYYTLYHQKECLKVKFEKEQCGFKETKVSNSLNKHVFHILVLCHTKLRNFKNYANTLSILL